MDRYYETTHANVHRGVYQLAEAATAAYEGARAAVAGFIGAPSPRGVVFTKNATEAINLVAHSYGRHLLRPGQAVLLTEMEHHANLVPWLMLREETGVELRFLPFDADGVLVLDDLDRLLDGVGLVTLTAMSNVLGTLNPVRQIADAAHAAGAVVLVDGSQYVPHLPTDVAALGCDLLAFTGHKMCGPTGIGVLWGKEDLLDAMPAFLGGGEMITDVRLDRWTPNELPWKFEAGTPPIAEAVGLGAAVDYLESLGMDAVREHEIALTALRPADPGRAPRRRLRRPRPLRPRGPRRRAVVRLPRHPSPRPVPGARLQGRVHQGRPPLRQAADAPPGRELDGPGVVLPLQRRGRRRRHVRRPPRHRRHLPSRVRTDTPSPCRSKTSTARSSSTTTATRGTVATCPARPPCGSKASTRCAATRWSSTSTSGPDGEVADIKISGQGCSISQSSASMMTAVVKGRTAPEARGLIRAFKAMMSIHEHRLDGDGQAVVEAVAPDPAVPLGDLEALRGVVKFPVRIKCATLSWNTLAQALDEAAAATP